MERGTLGANSKTTGNLNRMEAGSMTMQPVQKTPESKSLNLLGQ